ncbi:MAG: hypothetical protein ACI4OJ_07885 [Lachnospiraceae bacterium]
MDPYERLGNAVVLLAVRDWKMAAKRLKGGRKNDAAERVRAETEEFFLSDRFSMFTRIDGKALLKRLKKEAGI